MPGEGAGVGVRPPLRRGREGQRVRLAPLDKRGGEKHLRDIRHVVLVCTGLDRCLDHSQPRARARDDQVVVHVVLRVFIDERELHDLTRIHLEAHPVESQARDRLDGDLERVRGRSGPRGLAPFERGGGRESQQRSQGQAQ